MEAQIGGKGMGKRGIQRHNGRANVGFCDGHVENLPFKPLFLDTSDAALSRWNIDHQPHRK
jgi:prepilin-type processing-associated H-X9-DG protein